MSATQNPKSPHFIDAASLKDMLLKTTGGRIMIEYAINYVANFFYGLVLKSGFRVSYSPNTMRRLFNLIAGKSASKLKKKYGLTIEQTDLNGIRAEILTPETTTTRTILYLHGGGYFMGSILSYRHYASMFASECNVRVVLIEYRLAPEFPFPAALDDAVAAYKEVLKRFPDQLIFIAGDSAGGGLSLATGLFLRDHHLRPPSGILVISPWTDMTGSGNSVVSNHGKDIWLSKKFTDFWAPWYCGETDHHNPYVSPVFANYKNFPRTLLMVGDQEVLVDDSNRIYEAGRQCHSDIQLFLGRQMQHDWMLALPFLPESKRAWQVIRKFIGPV